MALTVFWFSFLLLLGTISLLDMFFFGFMLLQLVCRLKKEIATFCDIFTFLDEEVVMVLSALFDHHGILICAVLFQFQIRIQNLYRTDISQHRCCLAFRRFLKPETFICIISAGPK